ncbi:nitroreductase family protein [Candidatus Haliotispira prima]|uniref:Nitroreductase family protein n=1 Tax=Candidatus Haliotispira prima TaxID=3034016 RepID=A0ABY8MIN3_9SPIO|nr:nitroreductase family protein [Candidatus Haliotispira prima]
MISNSHKSIVYKVDFSAREDALADEMFVQRWSPRSFDGSALPQETLNTVFDAARFSPSAFNSQPWRIFSSKADRSDLDRFLKLLVDRNQGWAHSASALGFIIAERNFESGKENRWAGFDTGFAWAALTFQANHLGLYTHAMAGIKADEVYEEFGINREKYQVIVGLAIGKLALPDRLSDDFREKEKPSGRKALNTIYFPGGCRLD